MPKLIPLRPLSPEWHAARRSGVTATDIVTILGLSSRDSAYSLFWRKMGQVPEPEDSNRMRLGRELEPIIENRWVEQCAGMEDALGRPALYRSSVRAWQLATIDRTIERHHAGELASVYHVHAVLELKSWADAGRDAWDDSPPPQVRAQVLWQMDVMGVDTGHVGVVFLPSGEFRSYVIEHDVFIQQDSPHNPQMCNACRDIDLMRAAGEEFMGRLRLELPPPDPDASAATLAAVRARFTRQPDKTAEVSSSLWNAWYGAKQEAETWSDLVRKYEIQLREQAGEASVYIVDGQPVARRVIVDAQVKAHTRHQDYIRRIKGGNGGE